MTTDRSKHHEDDRPLPGEDTWVLIADYISGAATPEQRAAVEARRQTDTAFAEHVAAARLAWEHAGAVDDALADAPDTTRAWLRLAQELDREHDAAVLRTRPARPAIDLRRRSRSTPWRLVALAASVIAIAGIGVTLSTDLVLTRARAGAEVPLLETVARTGQRVAVTLPDGGRVMLAPGSTLRAPERFDGDVRRVVLSGRAYFEVAHDAARPFVVETDGVIVRVLGTEFDLRAYPGAPSAEVIVRSGRVAIRPPAASADADGADSVGQRAGADRADDGDTVLGAGERGVVDVAGTITVDERVNVQALLSWTDGRLVFERSRLEDVIADIERWYDVTIELAEPDLASLRLTAAFDGAPLDVVLETVAQLVNAHAQRDGRHIVISRTAL